MVGINKQNHEFLDTNGIIYSYDASTSLFVHGIDIDMDDLDIMIQWDYFHKSHEFFSEYSPTEIITEGFVQYHFFINGLKVHILGSPQITNLSEDPERVKILRDNKEYWSKSIFFYRKFLDDEEPYAVLIDEFVRKNKKYIKELYKS
jgi:hypothetical protein